MEFSIEIETNFCIKIYWFYNMKLILIFLRENNFPLLVIFVIKSLRIEILNNGAVTAPFHDYWFLSTNLIKQFSAINS